MLRRLASLSSARRLAMAVGVGVAAMAAVAGWFVLHPSATPPAAPPAAGGVPEAPTTAALLVYVSGAVVHPGLYHLTAGARVADALAAAGGLTSAADRGRLPNAAAVVHDGHQVNVPFLRSSTGGRTTSSRLDINTATVEELGSVAGMPPGLPQAIVEHRSLWGPFATVGELRTALGVDRATVTELGRSLRAAPPSP